MPFWEKFRTIAKAFVEGQAYSSGYFAPEDFEEQETDATDAADFPEQD